MLLGYLAIGFIIAMVLVRIMNDGGPPVKLSKYTYRLIFLTTFLWLPILVVVLLYALYESTAAYLYPEDDNDEYGC